MPILCLHLWTTVPPLIHSCHLSHRCMIEPSVPSKHIRISHPVLSLNQMESIHKYQGGPFHQFGRSPIPLYLGRMYRRPTGVRYLRNGHARCAIALYFLTTVVVLFSLLPNIRLLFDGLFCKQNSIICEMSPIFCGEMSCNLRRVWGLYLEKFLYRPELLKHLNCLPLFFALLKQTASCWRIGCHAGSMAHLQKASSVKPTRLPYLPQPYPNINR